MSLKLLNQKISCFFCFALGFKAAAFLRHEKTICKGHGKTDAILSMRKDEFFGELPVDDFSMQEFFAEFRTFKIPF